MREEKCCANCDFFQIHDNPNEGSCHKAPPSVFIVPVQSKLGGMKTGFVTKFPDVNPKVWCGAWEKQPTIEVKDGVAYVSE